MRTLLALPRGDRHGAKAGVAAAPDALVVDPGSVDLAPMLAARGGGTRLFVEFSAAAAGPEPEELARIAPLRPDGILLAGCVARLDVERLAARLAVYEAEYDVPDGAMLILAAFGTAKGWHTLAGLPGASRRLAGLLWNETAIRKDLGLAPDGPAPYACLHARSAAILTARAANVPALDATPSGGKDPATVAAEARREGFSGRLAASLEELAAVARAFA